MVKKWSWLNEGHVEVFSKSAMMTWLVSVDQIRQGTVLCEVLSDGGTSEGYITATPKPQAPLKSNFVH